MYKLEFLPIAKKDIDQIIDYISNTLKNPSAARNLAKQFIECSNNILQFPYGLSKYNPIKFLKNEYRCIKVNNYLMFYTINEQDKIITVVRVLYKKMNINNILN